MRRLKKEGVGIEYHMSMSDECEYQSEIWKEYREMRGNYCGLKCDGLSHYYFSDTVSFSFTREAPFR